MKAAIVLFHITVVDCEFWGYTIDAIVRFIYDQHNTLIQCVISVYISSNRKKRSK